MKSKYCSRWCAHKKCPFNFTLKEERKLRKKYPHGYHIGTREDLKSDTCGYIQADKRV